ncbi:PRC-barrel domain-containing protein [Rhodococcus indonesiensis]
MAAQDRPVPPILIDLDDTDLTLVDPGDDIRGRAVYDRDGDEIGTVDGLLVDEQDRTVRLLRIGSGGFLGLGKTDRLVPVDAVAHRFRCGPSRPHPRSCRRQLALRSGTGPRAAVLRRPVRLLRIRPFWGPGDIPPPVSPHIR